MDSKTYHFHPSKLTFDLRVREMCKSCKRYGQKATCPPHVEGVEYYKQLVRMYDFASLILHRHEINDETEWRELGRMSTMMLNSYVVKLRTELIQSGHYYAIGFGAGSCKLCEECAFPCKYPDKSLVPIEATGIEVVALVKDVANVQLKFPVKDNFYRVGLVLWN